MFVFSLTTVNVKCTVKHMRILVQLKPIKFMVTWPTMSHMVNTIFMAGKNY